MNLARIWAFESPVTPSDQGERTQMKHLALRLLLCLMALPAQSQEPPDVEQAANPTRTADPKASKRPDQPSSVVSRVDRASERERLADEFIPSEEVSADQAVAFPGDI